MVKHIQISFTPREFAMVHLTMKYKQAELLMDGYSDEMNVQDWKALNRAIERMNGARQLENMKHG